MPPRAQSGERAIGGVDGQAGLAPTDEARFSPEALALARGSGRSAEESERESGDGASPADASAQGPDGQSLTAEQQQQVEKLEARDAEVRAHEAAHLAAGGAHVRGGATYSYQQGPDGKQYAVGGEVGIDVSSIPNNPQATIQKMQQIRAAALAPAEPSGADHGVAAKAAQTESQAREQLAVKNAERISSAYSASSAPSLKGERIEATA